MADDALKDSLYQAYEGEAKASVRLKVFAEKADKEEYGGVAKLFRAVSESEAIHARNNLRLLREIKDTETNLSESFAKETRVAMVHYADFITRAEGAGDDNAARMFAWARDVEDVHAKLYEKALEHMLAGEDPAYYVCDVCGYVADGRVPERCPVCGSKSEVFFQAR